MKMTHGHKGSPIGGDTHARIEKHIRKHRASGGKMESPSKGDNEAEEDLKDKPARYNQSKVEDEGEAVKAKRGGKMKKCDMKASGGEAKKHAGRKPRASGGGCERNPFTTALKGTGPRGGPKAEGETEGKDD